MGGMDPHLASPNGSASFGRPVILIFRSRLSWRKRPDLLHENRRVRSDPQQIADHVRIHVDLGIAGEL